MHRSRSLFMFLALALAAVLAVPGTSLAHPDEGDGPASGHHPASATAQFEFTGDAQSWVVPAGVFEATVRLDGAQGGSSESPIPEGRIRDGAATGSGGKGANVVATLAVTPGQTYGVFVGGAGTAGVYDEQFQPAEAGAGGFNGGGDPSVRDGAGGGGASDIRIGPDFALGDRLLIAAGGGGGGHYGEFYIPSQPGCSIGTNTRFPGGDGGHSGAAGGAGTAGSSQSMGGGGGGPGTATDGGSGGSPGVGDGAGGSPGGPGTGGVGAVGARGFILGAGGGAGGGLYGGGGGGGGGGGHPHNPPHWCGTEIVTGSGGGGGGGSSFITTAATAGAVTEAVREGHGLVTISWRQGRSRTGSRPR